VRVSCPACNAELSLDVLLANEEARAAMARLATASVPGGAQLGGLVLRYLALFRPPKRRLSIDRMTSLLLELLSDIERQHVTRKGREWFAEIETWRTALETVLAYRDAGKLTLPLASHAYLYEVIVGLADKQEAAEEREREAGRKAERRGSAQPVAAGNAVLQPGAAVSATPVPPPAGPSRYAQALRAQIEARKARAEGGDDAHQD
jgi:hypothetical protein